MTNFILLLLFLIFIALLLRINQLKMEKTILKINSAETELYFANQLYERMLVDSDGVEINWELSGIAKQKRYIKILEFEISNLRKKKQRYFFLFY